MLRINVANNDLDNVDINSEPYLGFLLFTKKNCGADFVKGWWNGKIKYDIYDYYAKYAIMSTFVRLDKSQTMAAVQFR